MTKRDFTILAESFALACDLFSARRFAKDCEAFCKALKIHYPNLDAEAFQLHAKSCHASRTYPTFNR